MKTHYYGGKLTVFVIPFYWPWQTYLAIPATSIPSERAFSAAGHIVNKKRACLHPSSVNMLVFLSENLK